MKDHMYNLGYRAPKVSGPERSHTWDKTWILKAMVSSLMNRLTHFPSVHNQHCQCPGVLWCGKGEGILLSPRPPLACAPASLSDTGFGSGGKFCSFLWSTVTSRALATRDFSVQPLAMDTSLCACPGRARPGKEVWLTGVDFLVAKADPPLWLSSFLPADLVGLVPLSLVNFLKHFLLIKSAGDNFFTFVCLQRSLFCFQFYKIHSLEIKF